MAAPLNDAPVVIVGSAAWNTLVSVPQLPEPRPHTAMARSHVTTLGGTSAGKALNLSALGVPCMVSAMVGDDEDAEAISRALSAPGVDTALIRGAGPSEHHLNLMSPSGERVSIFLDQAPACPDALADDVLSAISQARIAVADLMPLGRLALAAARESAAAVWTDVHDYDGVADYHLPFIEAAQLVVMNDDGCDDVDATMAGVLDRGPFTVVCTRGKRGAVARTASGTAVAVPAVPTEVVDSNGAGDAFMAGMIAATLASGYDPSALDGPALESAMRAGARAASATVASSGIAPHSA